MSEIERAKPPWALVSVMPTSNLEVAKLNIEIHPYQFERYNSCILNFILEERKEKDKPVHLSLTKKI